MGQAAGIQWCGFGRAVLAQIGLLFRLQVKAK